MKASEWAFDRIKEAFDFVAKDEVEHMSIVQEIMLKSTAYVRRIISQVGGQGGVTMSYLCPSCKSFPLNTTFGGSLGENVQTGGAQFVEKSMTGGNRTGFWWCKQGEVLSRRRCSSACGTAVLVRKFDQCVEVADESARRWRRFLVEHCDKPRQRKQERSHGRPAALHQGGY